MIRKRLKTVVPALLLYCVCCAQITVENDSLFLHQKELFEQLDVFKAWEKTKGDPKILIGCIDNGFDFFHPYLHGRLVPSFYANDVYHSLTYQTMAHGTFVAGLIAAKPQTETGMHGLAPGCKVLAASFGTPENYLLKKKQEILKEHPDMPPEQVTREMFKDSRRVQESAVQWNNYGGMAVSDAIFYLVKKGVKVINISGDVMSQSSPPVQEHLNKALDFALEQDVLLVVSAGNGNREIPQTIKKRDNMLLVGACTKKGNRWILTANGTTQGSNWGKLLDVCAPVDSIAVCEPSDKRFYDVEDGPFGAEHTPYVGICRIMPDGGTSAAAPIVTALAALVYSLKPDMAAKEVKAAILQGCADLGDKGFDIYTGYGRVNFGNTIGLVTRKK